MIAYFNSGLNKNPFEEKNINLLVLLGISSKDGEISNETNLINIPFNKRLKHLIKIYRHLK